MICRNIHATEEEKFQNFQVDEMDEQSEKESEDNDMDAESEEDGDDSDDNDDEMEQNIVQLIQKVKENPYVYSNHTDLIKLLRQSGELEKLREARQQMSELFPLAEEIWLAWLGDEMKFSAEDSVSDREAVEKLFERAVKDYISVSIWLEYVQYSIGGISQADSISKIRGVFERAITASGLHVTKGASLWEAYREFENVVLSRLMPAAGCVATKEQEEKFASQHKRIVSLFKRQLSIPLIGMFETLLEYKQWADEDLDSYTAQKYKKACEKLKLSKPYEDALLTSEAPHFKQYIEYLDFELSQDDPPQIQCLFERAIQENCLESEIWIKYTNYLDKKLQIPTVIMDVYDRAVRNCPWCVGLWKNYLLALERHNESHDRITGVIDSALSSGISEGWEFLELWTVHCDYMHRRIQWQEEHSKELDDFQATIDRAIAHLLDNYGTDGDPMCSLDQFWANIEVKHCKNVERARQLWTEIMAKGNGSKAELWLEYYRMERAHGDNKHCRKILQRALNSVNDWPEYIVQAYINFEREEGTLELYDQAVSRCEAQMKRIQERRDQVAEKEEYHKKQVRPDKRSAKKSSSKTPEKHSPSKSHSESSGKGMEISARKSSEHRKTEKRRLSNDGDGAGVFKVPLPPTAAIGAPVPPVAKHIETNIEPVSKKMKGDHDTAHFESPREQLGKDPERNRRTVFVSNIAFTVPEQAIRECFTSCGEIEEIRLVKTAAGKSRGYGYVQFSNQTSVVAALKFDRQPLSGRPMYVSECIDKGREPAQFKYSSTLEKNKLFIKGLPFSCSKRSLETIFSQHGVVKEVRLVTHKSGAPKGLAYIVYAEESSAAQAILKTDGLQIGTNTISVAISNPPERKAPLKRRDDAFVPTLGSGKKETDIRGKARTQVSLVPRSLQSKQPSQVKPSSKPSNQETVKSDKHATEAASNAVMSNNDFRNMLFNK